MDGGGECSGGDVGVVATDPASVEEENDDEKEDGEEDDYEEECSASDFEVSLV